MIFAALAGSTVEAWLIGLTVAVVLIALFRH